MRSRQGSLIGFEVLVDYFPRRACSLDKRKRDINVHGFDTNYGADYYVKLYYRLAF